MNKKSASSFFTPAVAVSCAILLTVTLVSLLAPLIAPYDPTATDLTATMLYPSREHLFGTDQTGRDIFSRMLFGGRTTILGAFAIVLFSMAVGIPAGLVSGYFGGFADKLLMRITDVVISFPTLLLAFIFVGIFGRGLQNSVLAIGIVYIPMTARLTRSLTLSEKNKGYVEALKTSGCPTRKILFLQILPNCIPILSSQLTLDIGYAIIDLASMSFIGLGVKLPECDWGAMLEESRNLIFTRSLSALAPGIAIAVTVISINILSDGVQRYIDPTRRKLKRSVLRYG